MLSCYDVARYFLAKSSPDSGDLISNLKLQKLMYYAQGYHLAVFGKPLFNEEIQAWLHGPVVADLYHCYKQYGNGALPFENNLKVHLYTTEQAEFLDRIYAEYGQFSAWKLREMTHEEEPWVKSYESGMNFPISLDVLFGFFSKQQKRNLFMPYEINFDLEKIRKRVEDKDITVPQFTSVDDFIKWAKQK